MSADRRELHNSQEATSALTERCEILDRVGASNSDRSVSETASSVSCVETIDSSKQCWICLATEADDPNADWIKPCRCRGTSQWVHIVCLQLWIDEKQKGSAFTTVSCPQCGTQYIIFYPALPKLLLLLSKVDHVVLLVSPYVTIGVFIVSVYWIGLTYGALTVMEILGYKEGMDFMEHSGTVYLLCGLPAIPILLMLAKMIHWEEYVLNTIYRLVPWIRPGLHTSAASSSSRDDQQNQQRHGGAPVQAAAAADQREIQIAFNGNSLSRAFVSALALPTIATVCGRYLFRNLSHEPVKQVLLGGAAFIAVKGMLKIYFKHQQLVQRSQRKIQPFPNENDASVQAQTEDESDC